jgi:hypothetical protein
VRFAKSSSTRSSSVHSAFARHTSATSHALINSQTVFADYISSAPHSEGVPRLEFTFWLSEATRDLSLMISECVSTNLAGRNLIVTNSEAKRQGT